MGALDENSTPQPITPRGMEVVDMIHEYGLVLDTSHASEPLAFSILEYSMKTHPCRTVSATHMSVKHFTDLGRCASDEWIKGLPRPAACSGSAPSTALSATCRRTVRLHRRAWSWTSSTTSLTLVPADNIGLSTDAKFEPTPIGDFMRARLSSYDACYRAVILECQGSFLGGEPSKPIPALVDEMMTHNYSDKDIANISGGNFDNHSS